MVSIGGVRLHMKLLADHGGGLSARDGVPQPTYHHRSIVVSAVHFTTIKTDELSLERMRLIKCEKSSWPGNSFRFTLTKFKPGKLPSCSSARTKPSSMAYCTSG
jgi:hypothetical protein